MAEGSAAGRAFDAETASVPPKPRAPIRSGEIRELRLALVCYGGSSLAIYMHGTTKELHRLVRASALLEHGLIEHASPTEAVYYDLLATLAESDPDRLRTRVMVDIIAGTSAGGINGVCLAKALAHNLTQDDLRDLWLERGDVGVLLRAPKRLPRGMKLLYAAANALRRSPFRGGDMARWLHEALESMDRRGPEPQTIRSLMPPEHPLELFVTVTDFYGYDRQVPITDPHFIHDRRHRHVLEFRYAPPGEDDFDARSNAALSFAARSSASFPGVFPAVSFASFERDLGGSANLSDLAERFFRIYRLADAPPENTFFVDGGVLDNKPFGLAVDAIRRRPAEHEVDRRLLYLEPAPGRNRAASERHSPSTVSAVVGAASGLPRHEPVLDDLLDVAALNERVRRIQDIIEVNFDRVAELVSETLPDSFDSLAMPPATPDATEISGWMRAIRERADDEAGLGHTTYIRMRVSSVVDGLSAAACAVCDYPPDSNHAMLVRSTLRHWAKQRGLFEREPQPTERQLDFLRNLDLGYRRRRLRFMVDGLSGWYRHADEVGYPSRSDLDEGKALVYRIIAELDQTISGRISDAALRDQIRASFAAHKIQGFFAQYGFQADRYALNHGAELDTLVEQTRALIDESVDTLDQQLYRDLYVLTSDWPPERRRDLFVRYLGFPFWDILLYPVQSLSDVGERDYVQVVRLSPLDAKLLEPQAGQPKVKGIGIHHFGAFFSREDRENDYLWGRLDGAERLIHLLLGSDAAIPTRDWYRRAFLAVLEEEGPALPHAQPLVRHLHALASNL